MSESKPGTAAGPRWTAKEAGSGRIVLLNRGSEFIGYVWEAYAKDICDALNAADRALPASGEAAAPHAPYCRTGLEWPHTGSCNCAAPRAEAIEAEQRERLKKRLAGRPRPTREAFEDVGVPMLNEDTPPASGQAAAPLGTHPADALIAEAIEAAAPRAEAGADAIIERCAQECEGAQRDRWEANLTDTETQKWNRWVCQLADDIRALKGTLRLKPAATEPGTGGKHDAK